MDYALLSLGIVLMLLGLVGCFVPIIPGPSLGFLGIILLHATSKAEIATTYLIILGIATLAVTILDYIIPAWATKKFGGTKRGVWGATIGLVAGIFIPFIGVIIGPFLGALIGELTGKLGGRKAFIAALGSFVGFLFATGIKLILSGYMLYLFVKTAINAFI